MGTWWNNNWHVETTVPCDKPATLPHGPAQIQYKMSCGQTTVLGDKLATLTHGPPKIPYKMFCGQTQSSATKTRILNARVTRPLYSVNSGTVSLRTLIPTAIYVFRSKIGYWTQQHTDKTTHEGMRLHVYILYRPVPRSSE